MLSKRWIDLWTSVDTLDFDHRISGYDCENKCLQFIHGVLNRRDFSPLDKFKLSCWSNIRSDHVVVEECINHVVACMPRVIYISTRTHMFFNLPDSLFNCGSVKEMSLFSWSGLYKCEPQPKSINLPSLQKLELGHMIIKDCLIRMLLMGCPVLEELVMTHCYLIMNEINSNVLKKLTIKNSYFSCNAKSITLKNASSLVTADLDIFYGYDELNLLGGLPNVTSLRIYATRHVLGLLDKDIPNCPILNNLKSLELGELERSYGWNLVACFLQHSLNLKKLVLNFGHRSEVTAQEALLENFSFQHEFLQIVEIRVKDESEETVSEVVTTLGALVKTIGKIIIL